MIMNATSLTDLLESKPMVCVVLWESVKEYFQDEEHEKAFEVWYEKKYGKPYNRDQI